MDAPKVTHGSYYVTQYHLLFLGDVNGDGGVTVENRIFQQIAQFDQQVLSFLINPIHYQMIHNKVHTEILYISSIPFTNGLPSEHRRARSTIATARNMISYLFSQ